MKKLPTQVAEKVYDILMKFAEARQDYYSREEFIFHFGVVSGTSDSFNLSCMDGSPRTFICKGVSQMKMIGKGSDRINPMLRRLIRQLTEEVEFGEFTIRRNEVRST